MRIFPFCVPPYDNGTYIVADEAGDALVIDPAQGERVVLAAVREAKLNVVEILNTHGHGDHVFDNGPVKEATQARLAIHRADAYRLGPEYLTNWLGEMKRCDPDDLIDEGPLTYVKDLRLVALHTPGHTEGSTCFHLPDEGILFSGDVLFKGNVGRVDLPGGDAAAMERSLARVAGLAPGTRVYPGHGEPTVLANELGWLRGFRFGR